MPTSAASVAGDQALLDEALNDAVDGDTYINTTDGDQVMLFGLDGIASDVKAAWQQVKGEWFLDLNEGVDWYGVVLVKAPDLGAVTEEFIRVARVRPGVTDVPLFLPRIDKATRTLFADYAILADTGELITGQNEALTPGGA